MFEAREVKTLFLPIGDKFILSDLDQAFFVFSQP